MDARRQTRACLLRVRVGVPSEGTWQSTYVDVFVDDVTFVHREPLVVSFGSSPMSSAFFGARTGIRHSISSEKSPRPSEEKSIGFDPPRRGVITFAHSPANLSDRVEVHVWPGALWHSLSRPLRRRNRRLVQSCRNRQGTSRAVSRGRREEGTTECPAARNMRRSLTAHPSPLSSQAGGGVAGKAAVAAGASAVGYTAVTAAPAKPREPLKRP